MAKTAANLTDIINADALRALITEAAKSAAPEIKPIQNNKRRICFNADN